MSSTLLSLLAALVPQLAAPARGADAPVLARALDTVQAENICADIRFIASDDLEGRDTPSQGLRKAARYLRARLMRLGFTPGGDEQGYFHHYRMGRSVLEEAGTKASLTREGSTTELVFGKDYCFWPGGVANLDRAGEVVFVGQGSAEELQGVDLGGRFALVYEAGGRGGRMRNQRERETRLREKGAIGLIVAPDPAASDGDPARLAEADERLRGIAEWVRQGRLDVQLGEKSEVFPSVSVTSETARVLTASLEAAPEPGRALGVSFRDTRVAREEDAMVLENVAGLWPGSDPALSQEVIVVSAHYDHIGREGAQQHKPGEDTINNGADDNGSGTCGMLAIAEALQAYGPMKRSVLLLWVSGEEKGLKGSYAWTKRPVLPQGARVVCDLNIDMIGRNAPGELMITPSAEHPAYNFLTKMAEQVAPLEGFPALGNCDDYWRRSDQVNFSENLGVPVAFLFSGEHEDYHQPSDEAAKIDCDKIRRVARLVVRMLDGLQGETLGK
jgi:hypothetical protein